MMMGSPDENKPATVVGVSGTESVSHGIGGGGGWLGQAHFGRLLPLELWVQPGP